MCHVEILEYCELQALGIFTKCTVVEGVSSGDLLFLCVCEARLLILEDFASKCHAPLTITRLRKLPSITLFLLLITSGVVPRRFSAVLDGKLPPAALY